MKATSYISMGLIMVLLGCGESSTGPDSQVPIFPTLDQVVLDTFCVRGTASVPAIRPGSLSDLDCTTLGTIVGASDDGFFETWRVRVTSSTAVTFVATSDFDNFLDLFEINLASPNLFNLLDFDDDSGGGTNASVTWTLAPDVEYWIVVSGISGTDVGTYTLNIS